MTNRETDLDRSLAATFADDRAPASGEHRTPDELFAYLAGELGEEDQERLQAHLEGCRECLDLLLDLEPLALPETPQAGVTDLETAAAWRTLRSRLAAEKTRERTFLPSRLLQVAAAVFFVSTLALSGWVIHLERSAARLRDTLAAAAAPRLNVPVVYVDSTRSEETAGGLEMPPGQDFLLLMMTPADPRELASYEVEILDAGERPIWHGTGLEMSDYGSLRLGLSRRFLPPGRYRIRLYGVVDGESELLEEHPLEVR